mgnify:CR=1 FL=1
MDIDHLDGGLGGELVDVKELLKKAREETRDYFNSNGYVGYLQSAKRWGNFFSMRSGGLGAYKHYFHIGKAMMKRGKQVNAAGAKYLREILTGQSHCVADEED